MLKLPIISDIIKSVKDLVSEAIPDPDKRREVEVELVRIADAAEARLSAERIAQMEINKTEAQHGSVFVAGWRPFVGWVSGVGVATQAIILPVTEAFGARHVELDTALLMTTLTGMLGIAGMRTFEKVKGVSTNNYSDLPSRSDATDRPNKRGAPTNLLPEDAPWTK